MAKTFYQITKNEKHTIKPQNFRQQEVTMTNKVLREKSHCVVCRSNKSRFFKQKNKLTTDFIKAR